MNQRAAIVTGGGQGIGKATAKRLLGIGVAVVIADTDAEAGRETLAEYRQLGDIQFVPCDVADEAQVRRLIDAAIGRHRRLDALINNAGIGRCKPLAEATLADWNAVIGINLTSPARFSAPNTPPRSSRPRMAPSSTSPPPAR